MRRREGEKGKEVDGEDLQLKVEAEQEHTEQKNLRVPNQYLVPKYDFLNLYCIATILSLILD